MVIEGASSKGGRVSKRRPRNAHKKVQKSLPLTNIKIEDHKEFPPLDGPAIYRSSSESSGDYVPMDVSVIAGTTYYGSKAVPTSTLDASAAPFRSTFAESSPAAWNAYGIPTCCYGVADQQAVEEQGHAPGGLYFEQSYDDYEALTDGIPLQSFVSENLRKAAKETLEVEQETYFLPKDKQLDDVCRDYLIFFKMIEPEPGVMEGRENSVHLVRHSGWGKPLAVRKFHDTKLRNTRPLAISAKWETVIHPNVVRLYSLTTSYMRDDSSILFAYDYHPNAVTLRDFFNEPKPKHSLCERYTIDEGVVWSFTTQLVCALRAIHMAGLAVRTLAPQRILITGIDQCTVRINCIAIADVLEIADIPEIVIQRTCPFEHCTLVDYQSKDIADLGEVLNFMVECIEKRGVTPSGEMDRLVKSLRSGKIQAVDDVAEAIRSHAFKQLAIVQAHKDILEGEICKEFDNGRLFRLLAVVTSVFHECQPIPPYADKDAELVRLFTKYLFSDKSLCHQFSVLNKLDAGLEESVELGAEVSSTSNTCTYKEMKAIFQKRYTDTPKPADAVPASNPHPERFQSPVVYTVPAYVATTPVSRYDNAIAPFDGQIRFMETMDRPVVFQPVSQHHQLQPCQQGQLPKLFVV